MAKAMLSGIVFAGLAAAAAASSANSAAHVSVLESGPAVQELPPRAVTARITKPLLLLSALAATLAAAFLVLQCFNIISSNQQTSVRRLAAGGACGDEDDGDEGTSQEGANRRRKKPDTPAAAIYDFVGGVPVLVDEPNVTEVLIRVHRRKILLKNPWTKEEHQVVVLERDGKEPILVVEKTRQTLAGYLYTQALKQDGKPATEEKVKGGKTHGRYKVDEQDPGYGFPYATVLDDVAFGTDEDGFLAEVLIKPGAHGGVDMMTSKASKGRFCGVLMDDGKGGLVDGQGRKIMDMIKGLTQPETEFRSGPAEEEEGEEGEEDE
uniref:NPmz19 protein n=1 Tax=Eimeria necatrix TaxID=51315 RepID=Q8TA73_9EIME|nr:NPmz19 [Eimeria necatrix]